MFTTSNKKAITLGTLGACARLVLFLILLQSLPGAGLFCQSSDDPSPHSAAELIPEMESMRPGEPFVVGLRITLDPGWHSYWKNPGDAGQPAFIDWNIPAGFRTGEIQWPYPRIVEESTVVSYGYEDEVFLLTEILPPRFMTTGQMVKFSAEARWLVCYNICLPASASLEFELLMTDEEPAPAAKWESLFADTREHLPRQPDGWEMVASVSDDFIDVRILSDELAGKSLDGAQFFASERGVIVHAAPQVFSREEGAVRITLKKSPYLRNPLDRLTGVLVLPEFLELEVGRTRSLTVDAAVLEPAAN